MVPLLDSLDWVLVVKVVMDGCGDGLVENLETDGCGDGCVEILGEADSCGDGCVEILEVYEFLEEILKEVHVLSIVETLADWNKFI